ncbi:glutamate-cysteine ligase family protein [Cryomorphaceae bacterium 1068]|nr:glutamate-cysteine ligase family protein [Cryomorphaceae bacterium 1068]
MGELNVYVVETKDQRKKFVSAILKDMLALETMLERGMFESGITRIGAEQEFCFVDKNLRPSIIGLEVLEDLNDDHFTTELAKFNLEANLDPLVFTGGALSQLESDLRGLLEHADEKAKARGARVLLTGILPTILKDDLEFRNITPYERYRALNDAMIKHRGGDFEFHIKATDELITKHNTMLFEACNTSFQIHLQINPDEFVDKYNWAQAIAGPVLAASTNSPLLFGKRLWDETRIAVFEQTVDLKNQRNPDREQKSRVDFGTDWLKESVTEIFQYDVSYYRLLLASDIQEDAMHVLKSGKIPKLKALSLHNGTIYKWNRPCYGITDGKPHLRIENRYIPAGPTIIDEIANTAFWLGLMEGMPDDIGQISEQLDFDNAKLNFHKAAQMGLSAQFRWTDGKVHTAESLLLEQLIPMSRKGLQKMKINEEDISRYIDVIEARVKKHQTGSIWLVQSFNKLRKDANIEEAVVAVTSGMLKRQYSGLPVHEWDYPTKQESGSWASKYRYVHQVMSKELYTVQEDDLVELVSNVMNWRKIHHVPVENEEGEVVGIISAGDIIKYYCKHAEDETITVDHMMIKNPITVTAQTEVVEALKIMRRSNLGCLPVVKEKKLIGILTEFDFVYMAEYLFEELQTIEAERD